MRVSEFFGLDRTQPSLSFVDVRLDTDTPLFLSPRAIRTLPTDWGDECVALLQNFFGKVLSAIKDSKDDEAIRLLGFLKEPNETHLGLSKDKSRGRALGASSTQDVWAALARSEAAKSGLITDLEDTVLMIDGISVDIVSDILTNIIRMPLIHFTQEACAQYGIPTTQQVVAGPYWDSRKEIWITDGFVDLPTPNDEKLILVPKEIVRIDQDYDVDQYYRHFILEHYKREEIQANSALVHTLKSGPRKGARRVFIKDLKEKYGTGKSAVVRHTLANPQLLDEYKKANQKPSDPLPHDAIAVSSDTPKPDWKGLAKNIISCPTGRESANDYENAIEKLFTALFYPVLTHPRYQHEIHDGRKRIDISYTNMANRGFFKWLAVHYPCSNIFFECKNYGSDLDNPALDQISGRFSPNRGRVGFIVCRAFKNKALFEKRCKDTAQDQRGFVMALDDEDVLKLLDNTTSNLDYLDFALLRSKFNSLID